MSINGVNQATGCGGLYQTAPGCEMSAESLLIFCTGQLNNINGEINSCIKQQEQLQTAKKLLAEIKDVLAAFAANTKGPGQWAKLNAAFDKAIAGLPAGDPMRAALTAHKNEIFGGKYVKTATKEQLQAELSKVDTQFEEVKGNMEINMLRLQSAVSAKQTQMQLVTNMLSKQDQTLLTIAKNV